MSNMPDLSRFQLIFIASQTVRVYDVQEHIGTLRENWSLSGPCNCEPGQALENRQ